MSDSEDIIAIPLSLLKDLMWALDIAKYEHGDPSLCGMSKLCELLIEKHSKNNTNYVCVPRKPTIEMIDAGSKAWSSPISPFNIYSSMIGATKDQYNSYVKTGKKEIRDPLKAAIIKEWFYIVSTLLSKIDNLIPVQVVLDMNEHIPRDWNLINNKYYLGEYHNLVTKKIFSECRRFLEYAAENKFEIIGQWDNGGR